jgi:ABC-type polysaccharide/polyol phosphate transport system ATPase subunit
MPNEVVIRVERLSKQYRLGQIGGTTLREDVQRWWARVRQQPDPTLKVTETNVRDRKADTGTTPDARHLPTSPSRVPRPDFVWALQDVSFDVKRGEVLGIIGRNGAGKSTLLKILSRITAPTTGQVKVKGRIVSLLEVGTGMHPELTGRENIFLNGAILGMTKAEIAGKLDAIIDFSGCERFVDTPVKRYSSGMMVRLGFAVAAHLEPEILIVDEVLAVGDAEFQKKCIGKMQDVAGHGRTVLFVSHNMASIAQLTSRCMVLESGTTDFVGATDQAIERYLQSGPQPVPRRQVGRRLLAAFPPEDVAVPDPKVTLLELGLSAATPAEIPVGGEIEVDVLLQTVQPMEGLAFGYTVRDEVKGPVLTGYSPAFAVATAGEHRRMLHIRGLDLAPGAYDVCLSVQTGGICEPKYIYAIVWGLGRFAVGNRLTDNTHLWDWHRGWGRVLHRDAAVTTPAMP